MSSLRNMKYFSEQVNAKPLIFFRICFGLMMMVYVANKVGTEIKNEDTLGITPFGYDYRVPFAELLHHFPWYSMSTLYWRIHHPLELLAAVGISFGYGDISRLCCFVFGVLQLVFVLRYMSAYNNHEYMYATLAIALGLCDGHDHHYSPIFRGALDRSRAVPGYMAMALIVLGVGNMMLWNVVYGIPGTIGLSGMAAIIAGVLLTLGESHKTIKNVKDIGVAVSDDSVGGCSISTALSPPTVPRWNMLLLNVFVSVVYFYAGVAKLEEDWLNGNTARELFRSWVGPTALTTVIEFALDMGWPVHVIAYGGLVLDLFFPLGMNVGVTWLKVIFTCAAIGFHLTNHFTFVIETFPWVMIAAMSIFFDHQWIEWTSCQLEWIFLNRTVTNSYSYMRRVMRKYAIPLSAIIFVVLHVLIPLPCAMYAPLSKDLCWHSQCQFFSWRMMTRSVKVFGLFINVQHPVTRQLDSMRISNFNIDDREMPTIASFEDYLYDVAFRVKAAASTIGNVEFAPPIVTADVWFQVNGPPIQRFVNPIADLTAYPVPKGYNTKFLTYFNKPAPIAPWVEPRIQEYRTPFWREKMLNLTKVETHRYQKSGKDGSFELMFFADRAGEGRMLPLFFQEPMLLRVLAGSVTVAGLGTLQEGICVEAKGTVIVSPNAGHALWMVINIDNKIMSMKRSAVMSQRLEKPAMTRVHCDDDNAVDSWQHKTAGKLKRGQATWDL